MLCSISEIYNFEVAVLPKNDPPILYSGSEYVDMSPIGGELKSVTIDLMSSESTNEGEDSPYVYDVEGDSWEFKITDCPDNGKLIIGEHYEDSGIDGHCQNIVFRGGNDKGNPQALWSDDVARAEIQEHRNNKGT